MLRVANTSCGNRQIRRDGDIMVWAATAAKAPKQPSKFVMLCNLGDSAGTADLHLSDPLMPGAPLPKPADPGAYVLRDLWARAPAVAPAVSLKAGVLSAQLGPHSCALLLLSPAGRW